MYNTITATASPSRANYCQSETPSLTASVTSSNNNSPITYQWYTAANAGSTISGATSATYTGGSRTAGSHTYYVRVSDGCTSTDFIRVDYNVYGDLASSDIAGVDNYCLDATATALSTTPSSGSGSYSYQWQSSANGSTWSNTGSNSSSFVPATNSAGTTYYRVVVSDNCTSVTVSSVQITINYAPTAPTGITGNDICFGESVELTATGGSDGDGSTYQWGTGSVGENIIAGETSSTITVTPTATTTYWVRRVGNTACVNSTSGATKLIAVNIPDIAGVSNYDYIWRGVTSTNWNAVTNWFVYDSENERYSVASSMPETPKNYYIGNVVCLSPSYWPSLNVNASVNNVTIEAGSFTIPSGRTLSIAGSVRGTITAQSGSTIEFVGSDNQNLSDAATFSNVRFAQTAGGKKIIAPNGITVNNLATFETGVVSGDMLFSGSASATEASLTSYVEGNVTKILGSAAFTFPLGSNGVLGEVDVPAIRSGGTVSMRFNKSASEGGFDQEHDGYPRCWNINDMCTDDGANRFHHVSNVEYWDISTTEAIPGVTFRSIASSDIHFNNTGDNARDVSAIKFALYNNCWKNMGGTASVSPNYYELTVSGVYIPVTNQRTGLKGSFGSTDDETLLPIELLSFSATCDGKSAFVEWSTASERNNDYFVIERSDDAINFTEVGRVAGAGNSIEQQDYTYTDYGIHGGDNYYRLVQVDYDGTRTVSEIIVATCDEPEVGEPDVQAYPNPFNGELTLVLDNFENRPARIEVYDMLGKLIMFEKVDAPQNSYETILNLYSLPPAAYNVRVSTVDFVINKQVVKN